MRRPRTIKSFLKVAKMLADMPISGLKGYSKLTEKEESALGFLVAGIANDLSDPNIESIKNDY